MASRRVKRTGRYVLSESDNSNSKEGKFWEAEATGKFVTIRFGKIGTSGHRATREFGSVEEAERFMAERLLNQIEKGYRPV
ncbi:MAG: WGR domain-containing protein [Promethearchaeota archaeon]